MEFHIALLLADHWTHDDSEFIDDPMKKRGRE
jgi:hypothetical protein